MQSLHDFVNILDDVKEVLLALASTILLAIICGQIILEKVKPKK